MTASTEAPTRRDRRRIWWGAALAVVVLAGTFVAILSSDTASQDGFDGEPIHLDAGAYRVLVNGQPVDASISTDGSTVTVSAGTTSVAFSALDLHDVPVNLRGGHLLASVNGKLRTSGAGFSSASDVDLWLFVPGPERLERTTTNGSGRFSATAPLAPFQAGGATARVVGTDSTQQRIDVLLGLEIEDTTTASLPSPPREAAPPAADSPHGSAPGEDDAHPSRPNPRDGQQVTSPEPNDRDVSPPPTAAPDPSHAGRQPASGSEPLERPGTSRDGRGPNSPESPPPAPGRQPPDVDVPRPPRPAPVVQLTSDAPAAVPLIDDDHLAPGGTITRCITLAYSQSGDAGELTVRPWVDLPEGSPLADQLTVSIDDSARSAGYDCTGFRADRNVLAPTTFTQAAARHGSFAEAAPGWAAVDGTSRTYRIHIAFPVSDSTAQNDAVSTRLVWEAR